MTELSKVKEAEQEQFIKDSIIKYEKKDSIFLHQKTLDTLIRQVTLNLSSNWPDFSELNMLKEEDRKTLSKIVRQIGSASKRIDEHGKAQVDELKKVPKAIDKGRKYCRDYFTKWKDEIGEPLAAYKEREKQALEEMKVKVEHEMLDERIEKGDKSAKYLKRNKEILNDVMLACPDIKQEHAKTVITAIIKKKIRHVGII